MTGRETTHRWAFEDDPLSGESVGYCENNCGEHWYADEEQPTSACPGDVRPPTTARMVVTPPARETT